MQTAVPSSSTSGSAARHLARDEVLGLELLAEPDRGEVAVIASARRLRGTIWTACPRLLGEAGREDHVLVGNDAVGRQLYPVGVSSTTSGVPIRHGETSAGALSGREVARPALAARPVEQDGALLLGQLDPVRELPVRVARVPRRHAAECHRLRERRRVVDRVAVVDQREGRRAAVLVAGDAAAREDRRDVAAEREVGARRSGGGERAALGRRARL
jgi:hypothetical protein